MAVSLEMNEERFLGLMENVIGESEFVQNHPPKNVPEEDRVIAHCLKVLAPFDSKNGGPINIKHIAYKPGRGNLILEYKPASATKGTLAFVGSHLDVVPADPEGWEMNPFKLSRDGDKLFGRGTTDCLGHVCMVTDLFCALAEQKPDLNISITAVFIASEENNSAVNQGTGVDKLVEDGHLEHLKGGPVLWIDSADSQPCIGTAGVSTWTLRAEGRLFHSGLPHKGINSIELASEAVAKVQERFFKDFPPHEQEKVYNFATPSTMKPTQVKCSEGGLNQIPPWCEIQGDVRLTPFYTIDECIKKISSYVDDINADLTQLATRGPCSKYEINIEEGDFKGSVKITWDSDPFKGIACKLDSPGFFALRDAIEAVKGEVKPYAICGSLPLVGDMQAAGFDVQVCGFGISAVYHGDNEYCKLSDMKDATKVLSKVINTLNDKAGQ